MMSDLHIYDNNGNEVGRISSDRPYEGSDDYTGSNDNSSSSSSSPMFTEGESETLMWIAIIIGMIVMTIIGFEKYANEFRVQQNVFTFVKFIVTMIGAIFYLFAAVVIGGGYPLIIAHLISERFKDAGENVDSFFLWTGLIMTIVSDICLFKFDAYQRLLLGIFGFFGNILYLIAKFIAHL